MWTRPRAKTCAGGLSPASPPSPLRTPTEQQGFTPIIHRGEQGVVGRVTCPPRPSETDISVVGDASGWGTSPPTPLWTMWRWGEAWTTAWSTASLSADGPGLFTALPTVGGGECIRLLLSALGGRLSPKPVTAPLRSRLRGEEARGGVSENVVRDSCASPSSSAEPDGKRSK